MKARRRAYTKNSLRFCCLRNNHTWCHHKKQSCIHLLRTERGWMDKWMNRWMNGWVDKWLSGYTHGFQPPGTPISEDPSSSSGLREHWMHMVHRHKHRQNHHTQTIIKINLFLNTYRKKLLADLVELLQPPRGFSH